MTGKLRRPGRSFSCGRYRKCVASRNDRYGWRPRDSDFIIELNHRPFPNSDSHRRREFEGQNPYLLAEAPETPTRHIRWKKFAVNLLVREMRTEHEY